MKLPLSWLKDYTNIDGVTPKEFDAKMTMSGSKVESVCLLYTSPSPRDGLLSRMPSSA